MSEKNCLPVQNKIFFQIKCRKCKINISKSWLPGEVLVTSDKVNYRIKPYYLKCITFYGKIKLNEYKNFIYLYENVKCVSCENKFGRYIKSCTNETWDLIENVIFNEKHLEM